MRVFVLTYDKSQLRFYRKKTHETDTEMAPEAGVGVNFKDAFFSMDYAVPEYSLGPIFIGAKLQPERDLLDILIEPRAHPGRNFR